MGDALEESALQAAPAVVPPVLRPPAGPPPAAVAIGAPGAGGGSGRTGRHRGHDRSRTPAGSNGALPLSALVRGLWPVAGRAQPGGWPGAGRLTLRPAGLTPGTRFLPSWRFPGCAQACAASCAISAARTGTAGRRASLGCCVGVSSTRRSWPSMLRRCSSCTSGQPCGPSRGGCLLLASRGSSASSSQRAGICWGGTPSSSGCARLAAPLGFRLWALPTGTCRPGGTSSATCRNSMNTCRRWRRTSPPLLFRRMLPQGCAARQKGLTRMRQRRLRRRAGGPAFEINLNPADDGVEDGRRGLAALPAGLRPGRGIVATEHGPLMVCACVVVPPAGFAWRRRGTSAASPSAGGSSCASRY